MDFVMIRYHLSSGSGGMADALDSGSSGSFILWEFKSPLPHEERFGESLGIRFLRFFYPLLFRKGYIHNKGMISHE